VATDPTAFAFRCGPPEGHHVADLLPRIPEWLLRRHAHPDAGSFIVITNGATSPATPGYTGVKMTADRPLFRWARQENDGARSVRGSP
jgi:hypothetical protein